MVECFTARPPDIVRAGKGAERQRIQRRLSLKTAFLSCRGKHECSRSGRSEGLTPAHWSEPGLSATSGQTGGHRPGRSSLGKLMCRMWFNLLSWFSRICLMLISHRFHPLAPSNSLCPNTYPLCLISEHGLQVNPPALQYKYR